MPMPIPTPLPIDDIPDLELPVANAGAIRALEQVADHVCEYITAIVIMTSTNK